MNRFRSSLIATVATIAFVQIALAAPPPPPVYNWTGFYIGGNVGFSAGKADTDFNAAPVTVGTNFGPISIPGFAGSESVQLSGLIGGGQIGYNWQFSPNWVVGLEADIQGSGEKGSRSFGSDFLFAAQLIGAGPQPVKALAATDYEAKILWFGTVRGRIGYTWDRVMLYATGGLAYGEVKLEGTHTVSGTVGFAVLPSTPPSFSIAHAIGHSQVNTGWTVGAGAEVALGGNWTGKFEYLYMDLGSLNDSDVAVVQITSVTGGQTFTRTRFTDNIFRVGLNYKFW